jgi:hypothetical protein
MFSVWWPGGFRDNPPFGKLAYWLCAHVHWLRALWYVPSLAWSPHLEECTAGAPAGQGYCYCYLYMVQDVPECPVRKLDCAARAGG